MGQWKHRKPEPPNVRGFCVICKNNLQKKVSNKEKYRPICSPCDKSLYQSKKVKPLKIKAISYRYYKKDYCERCGFVPEDSCQLDVDHIDQDHSNNDPSNLQTLCSNCHRLKTKQERQPPPT